MWFPELHEIKAKKNPSYLNSVFIGFTAPWLMLPKVLWRTLVKPVVVGLVRMCAWMMVLPAVSLFGYVSTVPRSRLQAELEVKKRKLARLQQEIRDMEIRLSKTK